MYVRRNRAVKFYIDFTAAWWQRIRAALMIEKERNVKLPGFLCRAYGEVCTMKFDLPRSGRTLRSLLFFSAYFTLFWLSCWCMATRCSRLYDTLFSDLLLTASFCLAFFPPMFRPQRRTAIALSLVSLGLLLGAAAFFALFCL